MRILIAEDSSVQRQILTSVLEEWGYEVVSAEDGNEAWNLLRNGNAPQLALLDWIMPEMDGTEVCQKVRERGNEPYTYLILLTSLDEKTNTVKGLDAGADDYLTKPFDPHELRARLRVGERMLEIQRELITAREELRLQATQDSLTGMLNRRLVLDILERELTRGQRLELPLAVLMIDIDHFKAVNDAYGHQAGDAVLKEVAARVSTTVRPYDSVGRYGGEEFLVILPGCDEPRAQIVAERLCCVVSREVVHTSAAEISVTLSLGLALSAQGETSERLVHAADRALYEAKRNGRNRVVVSQSSR
ncbi:MAG: diguanylate cyclase response regulator [Armatimonadetes bacterium CG2_30_59_28]|nr:MAG: diguanylate cyclase response regulator [Armatimonadetes bacterium CG2_30_59_28]PIU65468.1 MAG: diguanylate cyclase response regulator [Armatimonadetes bacterium CG07_land_8_20_14_0_80_59_28]PIX42123.1 MAG: diguanylate cyclase response regulator [Armatimonadetes bacterium CG_4_8_14_3_um_filter_58_9]